MSIIAKIEKPGILNLSHAEMVFLMSEWIRVFPLGDYVRDGRLRCSPALVADFLSMFLQPLLKAGTEYGGKRLVWYGYDGQSWQRIYYAGGEIGRWCLAARLVLQEFVDGTDSILSNRNYMTAIERELKHLPEMRFREDYRGQPC